MSNRNMDLLFVGTLTAVFLTGVIVSIIAKNQTLATQLPNTWCDTTDIEYFISNDQVTSVRYTTDGFIKHCSK